MSAPATLRRWLSQLWSSPRAISSEGLDRAEVIVFPERRLEGGVPQPIPDKVDIELIVVALVQEPVGETVAENMRVDVLRVTASEVPILVFVGTDISFDRSAFNEIPD